MAAADVFPLFKPWWDALAVIVSNPDPVAEAPRSAPGAQGGADALAAARSALGRASPVLPQVLQTLQSLMTQGGLAPLTEIVRALSALGGDNLQRIAEAWNGGGSDTWQSLLGAQPTSLTNPLTVGVERTFGAFADALGLRPMRELQKALQQLAAAESERSSALSAYLGVVVQAFGQGSQQLPARLSELAERGEAVTSLVAFIRLWVGEIDSALQTAMQSEAGLAATAQAMRASLKRRAELQRLVALASGALNIPSRAEVDDAFREIQQLKREVRHLKKGTSPQPQADAEAAAGTAGAPTKRPARAVARAPARPVAPKAPRKSASGPRGTARTRHTGASK